MLDHRVRTALVEYQRGTRTLEDAAQLLAQVRRETGCLELQASPSAGAAERALLRRFAELTEPEGGGKAPNPSSPQKGSP
jgi:hypothetical protein